MYVYTNPQRQWLAAAEQELAERLEQRRQLDQRIAELEQTIQALRPIVQNADEMADLSLPKLCLKALSFSGSQYQTATQIRDGLKAMGVHVPGQNPMGVIHTTLGRLARDHYVEARSPRPGAALIFRLTTAGRLALQEAGI